MDVSKASDWLQQHGYSPEAGCIALLAWHLQVKEKAFTHAVHDIVYCRCGWKTDEPMDYVSGEYAKVGHLLDKCEATKAYHDLVDELLVREL